MPHTSDVAAWIHAYKAEGDLTCCWISTCSRPSAAMLAVAADDAMFGFSIRKWLPSRSPEQFVVPAKTPAEIQLLILEALADCNGDAAERMRQQVRRSRSGTELWLMRCDIYHLVACAHCEDEARRRVNGLLPAFEGWVPPGARAARPR